jgi:putative redox protein
MPEVTAVWQDGLEFSVQQDGHEFTIDGSPEFGGHDRGPRPKNLLLSALAGCTGMDVVSILSKMRIEDYSLKILASGEYTDEHPKVFRTLHIEFVFAGADLPREKLERAVELSQEKYCGVSAMLRHTAEIDCTITVNGQKE